MNSKVMPSHVQMEADELKNLVNEVKETVATEVNDATKKFSVIDLWQIQKQMKKASGNSNRWNLN